MYIDEEKRPEPVSATNFAVAVVLHALFFAVLWFAGQMSFRDKEVVIPIELTVVPFENLDGNENEPPPVAPPEPEPEPEPEPPPPEPAPEPPPPPDPPPEAVVETPPENPPEPPKVEEKKPEPPKPKEKTEEERRKEREERLKKMRESATTIKDRPKPEVKPQNNGKTGPKTLSDEEMRRLLAMGARIGAYEQVSNSEEAISLGALKRAMDDKWAQLAPQVGRDGDVHISITFDRSRRIATSVLAKSSGDATTDAAALKVVRALGVVPGITTGFAEKYSRESITIRYHVNSSR